MLTQKGQMDRSNQIKEEFTIYRYYFLHACQTATKCHKLHKSKEQDMYLACTSKGIAKIKINEVITLKSIE